MKQTHVATRSLGTLLHVFETTIQLPRFAAFKYLDDSIDNIAGGGNSSRGRGASSSSREGVTFVLKDSLDRMLSWVQTSFLTPRLIKVCAVGWCRRFW